MYRTNARFSLLSTGSFCSVKVSYLTVMCSDISSVGLGDIYLEPEVIVGLDLVVFPVLFLTGFTFLSCFLQKTALVLYKALSPKGSTMLELLVEKFKKTDVVPEQDEGDESKLSERFMDEGEDEIVNAETKSASEISLEQKNVDGASGS